MLFRGVIFYAINLMNHWQSLVYFQYLKLDYFFFFTILTICSYFMCFIFVILSFYTQFYLYVFMVLFIFKLFLKMVVDQAYAPSTFSID